MSTPEETPQDVFVLPEDFVFNPETAMDDLSFGDVEDIEEVSGLPLDKLQTSIRGVRAMIWALLRKDYPNLTFEQTRDLPMSTIIGDSAREIAKDQTAALEEPQDAEGKDEQ